MTAMFGSTDRLKYVEAKTWNTKDNPGLFPEQFDEGLKDPWLTDARKRVGVCFSGGGSRSAAATLGQLCALRQLGLLDNIGYISSVSGGSWCSLPFTYLPEARRDEDFLGEYLEPGALHPEVLERFDAHSYGALLADSQVLDDVLKQAVTGAGDESFSRAISTELMEPLGISTWPEFFTRDRRTLSHILSRNPQMRATDFQLARPNRPFHIAGGTLLRLDNGTSQEKFHFEMTPLYVGTNSFHGQAGAGARDIGGGYVEPFGFDSKEPAQGPQQDGTVRVTLRRARHRFGLADVMGTTGAAPAEISHRYAGGVWGFPEFNYWSPADPTRSAQEYDFGDGAHLENTGLLALVKRRVEKIVAFINTRAVLSTTSINDSMPPFFQGHGRNGWPLNEVFPGTDFPLLCEALLQKKAAGKTVMHRMRHQVLDNAHYGIEGGRTVEVLWVYNERVPEWERELPVGTRNRIASGSLSNFPHYRTFFQNATGTIDLTKTQVTLLKQLSAWNIVSNEDQFRDMLA